MSAQNDPFYNQFFKNNADQKIQYDENGNPINPNTLSSNQGIPGATGTIIPGIESMAVKQGIHSLVSGSGAVSLSGLAGESADAAAGLDAAASAGSAADITGGTLGELGGAGAVGGIGMLPLAAIAGGTILGGKGAYDEFQGKTPNLASRAVLDMATGGLNELAIHFLTHESTKDLEAKKWGGVANSTDPTNAAYGKQYQEYLASPQAKIDATGPNTFDAKKAAGNLKPEDVWGGAGLVNNIPGWLTKYSEGQRKDISQQLLNQNLITSDHGDLELTDVDKANALAQSALSGKQNPIVSTQPASIQGNPPLSSVAPPGLLGPVTQLDPAVQGQIAQMQKQSKLSAIQPYLNRVSPNANFNNFGGNFKGF